jgi:toxin ParE1/3/4
MQLIAHNPGLARSAAFVHPDLLKTVAGSHVAYFRNTGDSLLVTRILHGKMDPEKWLKIDIRPWDCSHLTQTKSAHPH